MIHNFLKLKTSIQIGRNSFTVISWHSKVNEEKQHMSLQNMPHQIILSCRQLRRSKHRRSSLPSHIQCENRIYIFFCKDVLKNLLCRNPEKIHHLKWLEAEQQFFPKGSSYSHSHNYTYVFLSLVTQQHFLCLISSLHSITHCWHYI